MKGKNKRKAFFTTCFFFYVKEGKIIKYINYQIFFTIFHFSNIFHSKPKFPSNFFSLFLIISFIQTEASCCIVERLFGSKHVNILFIQISKYFFLNSFFFFIVSVITFIIHIATNLTVSCLESDTNNYKQKR